MYGLMQNNNGIAQFKNRVVSAFKRAGVHILALTVSFAALKGVEAPLLCYAGLICLFHRGFDLRRNDTLFPLVTSLGQLALCMVSGIVPLHMAVFLSGAQSWLQRAVTRKFKLGLDWAVAPVLLAGFFTKLQDFSYPWGLLGLTCLCGLGCAFIAQSLDARSLIPTLAMSLVPVIDAALVLPALPKELAVGLEKMKAYCLAFSAGFPRGATSQAVILQMRLGAMGKKLAQLPQLSETQLVLQGKTGLQDDIDALNALFARADALRNAQADNMNALTDKQRQFSVLYESVGQLDAKAASMPKYLQPHLANIAASTNNILQCMCTDERDVQPGTRFLERYLPAVHKIVDEYVRLEKEGAGHKEIEQVLGKMDEVLERMAAAFHQEHGSLLRNDAIALSAELNVLDKLLKMDGK